MKGKKGKPADDRGLSKIGKDSVMGKSTRENTTINKENSTGLGEKHVSERPESHMTELSFETEEK